jgi:hypothetical protein
MVGIKTRIRSVNGVIFSKYLKMEFPSKPIRNENKAEAITIDHIDLPGKRKIKISYDCKKDIFSYNCSTKRFFEIITKLNVKG